MNIKSEQLKSDFSLIIDFDQKLSIKEIRNRIKEILGEENCFEINFEKKRLLCYKNKSVNEILILASITYLGGNGQHPIFKKRMQLKKWYKAVAKEYQNKSGYNVRFIGVYHYEGNIILTEFIKETYLNRKMNSSAAHVFTNDLYQAMRNGVFKRVDRFGNKIVSIRHLSFKDYLAGKFESDQGSLFSLFEDFNARFFSGDWLKAKDAIQEMYKNKWRYWKETEWPGWYLEYKFDNHLKINKLENEIKYVGNKNKGKGELDFDLYFTSESFYGDLKASDILKEESPGNDQERFLECIQKHDKFWYVIFEHETLLDKNVPNTKYEATVFRANFILSQNEWPKDKPFNPLSYFSRMKNSVKFVKMFIIELNQVNYMHVLSDFHQGRQPNGGKRMPKFKISKNEIDNYIVYQYSSLR